MFDRTRGFHPFRPERHEIFLMSPQEHRVHAFKLRQLKGNPKAAELAKHHEFLAKHIQRKLNQGAARIM